MKKMKKMKKVLTVLAVVLFIGLNVTIISDGNENGGLTLNTIVNVVANAEASGSQTHTTQQCGRCPLGNNKMGAYYFCFEVSGPGTNENCFDWPCGGGYC